MLKALTGVFINVGAVIVGSLLGLVLKRGIPEKYSKVITQAIGISVVFIGISGALRTENIEGTAVGLDPLILILSMIIGAVIGTALKIDEGLSRLGKKLEARFSKQEGDFAKGFVNATLLFCVGAMAITGSMESALKNDHSTLIAKSVLDGRLRHPKWSRVYRVRLSSGAPWRQPNRAAERCL